MRPLNRRRVRRTCYRAIVPRMKGYKIAAIFEVGMSEYDSSIVYMPFSEAQLGEFLQGLGVGIGRLRVEGNSIVTVRATARLRLQNGQLSDLRRTVGAQVKYMPTGYDAPVHILRWYDAR